MASDFPLILDHIAVFVAVGAPEARTLTALGLRGSGETTPHEGLGTASTSFFFSNTYLELLWEEDAALAAKAFGPIGLDIHGRMRWRETGASPFGLMLRHRPGTSGETPFPTRSIRAAFLPGDVRVEFAADVPAEPYCGVVPEVLSFPAFQAGSPAHPLGVRALTGVRIVTAADTRSLRAEMIARSGVAAIEAGERALMELTFDDGARGTTADARPALPLVLKL